MMKLNYVATLLMIFIKCLMCVYSIKCYQCRSDLHDRCVVLETKEYLVECPARQPARRHRLPKFDVRIFSSVEPYCRKITQALYFTAEYKYTTIRECAYTHEKADICYRSPWKDSKVVMCDCAREGCNRGYSKHRKKPLAMVLFCTIFSLMSWKVFLRNNQMLLQTWT